MEAYKANSTYNLIQGFRRTYDNKSRLHLISLYILQNTIFTSNKSILVIDNSTDFESKNDYLIFK